MVIIVGDVDDEQTNGRAEERQTDKRQAENKSATGAHYY